LNTTQDYETAMPIVCRVNYTVAIFNLILEKREMSFQDSSDVRNDAVAAKHNFNARKFLRNTFPATSLRTNILG